MEEALKKSWKWAWEEETRARELEVLGGAERMIWVTFRDKIGDIAWGRVVSGFPRTLKKEGKNPYKQTFGSWEKEELISFSQNLPS